MSLYSKYHGLSDDNWLKLLTPADDQGAGLARVLRKIFASRDSDIPTLPPAELQAKFVGSSGAHALKEGFQFYQFVKRQSQSFGRPISPETRILDFGCGWGRIIRFFLKDVPSQRLLGLDVDPEVIEVARQTIPEAHFDIVNPSPPAKLENATFDVIYAYSVFSHLSEDAHMQWVQEFARLLKPGGLVIATTQKRDFIEYCNSLTEKQIVTNWHRSLSKAFRPLEDALSRYDRGEFLYSGTGGGGVRDASFYGEAAVSEGYVDRCWSPYLTKLAFDHRTLPQAVIVARKVA